MKRKWLGLSQRYQTVLRKHLQQGPRASVRSAEGLGRQALAHGLDTLDLARIHERALVSLDSALTRDGAIRQAEIFFVEAISPIEQNHRAMRDANAHLSKVNGTLRRRTEQLVATNRQLQQEIVRRHAAEVALKKSKQHYSQLLEQSHRMQEQLRHLSRQLLSAQEEERKEISRELHDEIAQTLTGINVHLATLKAQAGINIKGLQKKIASTQRLVERSVNIVHRFARELRPTVLDDLGLIPALHSFIKDFTKRLGIQVRFTAFAEVEQLNSTKRTVLYRVVQAALTNAAQHAQASRVEVSIQKHANAVRLVIHDNGKGFEVERVLFAKRYKRLGLLGMRERVEMVGGSFTVESAPRKGTTIQAEVSFNNGGTRGGGGRR